MVNAKGLLGPFAVVFGLRATGAMMQFFFQMLVAKQCGVDNFGLFSVALTITVVCSIVARWGVDQWVLRELPATLVEEKKHNFPSILGTGLIFVTSIALVVTLIMVAASDYIVLLFVGEEYQGAELMMHIMILSIFPFTLINFFAESFRALEKHVVASLLQLVLIPLLSIVLFTSLLRMDTGLLISVALAYTISVCAVFSVGGWGLFSLYRVNRGNDQFVWQGKSILEESHAIAMVVFLSTWLAYADVLVLGYFQGAGEVGLYAAAQRIVLMLSFVLLSFNSLLGPKFTSLNQQGKYKELFALYKKSTQWMVVIGLPIVLVLALWSKWFLSWFGSDFIDASPVLLLLLLGQVFNVLTGPVGVMMIMMRYTSQLRKYTLLTVMVHFLSMLIFMPIYGAIGAAMATCIGMVTLNVLCWRFVESLRRFDGGNFTSKVVG